jgi:methylated-DNA-[protein]-cysteine S-methyltransferase
MTSVHKIEFQYHKSIIGELIIGSYKDKLCLLDYKYRNQRQRVDLRLCKRLNTAFIENNNKIIDKTINELNAYLDGKLKKFSVPIRMVGSVFQKNVWEALQKIPYGKTLSYIEITTKLNLKPTNVRAVASANGANAISVIIPCHRIIGNDGRLIGYAGGIETKKKLLQIEKSNTINQNELPLWY